MTTDNFPVLVQKGHDARESGDLEGAADFFAEALALEPDDLSLRLFLADTLMALRNFPATIALLEKPAENHPMLVPLLAEALEAEGKHAQAASWLEHQLIRRPSGHLHHHLARIHTALGNIGDAREHYAQALFLTPYDAVLLFHAAAFHLTHGWLGPALDLAQRALRCANPPDGIHLLMGDIWTRMAEADKAMRHYQMHRTQCPQDGDIITLRIMALADSPNLSPDFVRGVFDQYADRFDADLVNKLQYHGPLVISQALAPFLVGCAPKSLAILDLGCGTGLSGEPFAPLAARMDGCDLSPKMLEKAEGRHIYTQLSTEDFIPAMRHGTWDLVLAVDAFVYVGALSDIFAVAAETLRPGGFLAATFEAGPDTGFIRKPCKRFGHAETYLRETALASGFDILVLETASSRMEKREPVSGFVMVCQKRL